MTGHALTAAELQRIVAHALRKQIMRELKISETCCIKRTYDCRSGNPYKQVEVHWDSVSDKPTNPFVVVHCPMCFRFQIRKVHTKTMRPL